MSQTHITPQTVQPQEQDWIAPDEEHSFLNVLLSLLVLSVPFYFMLPHLQTGTTASSILLATLVVALVAFMLTILLVHPISQLTLKAHLYGKDLNKGEKGHKMRVPESLGIVPGTIYIVAACMLQLVLSSRVLGESIQFSEFNAGLFSTCFMVFLGFADDVLELRWRYKLVLPSFATLPLLIAYHGVTNIVVPKPFRPIFGDMIELGLLYKVYMGFITVFCTNSINIFAGVNGLEAGQSLLIAISIVIHNCIELSGELHAQHLYSMTFMILFIATTMGLLRYNWFPSSVFVGDTFTYYAGITFAVVGILGHFSKTLMLFFIPQWINFLLSLPQLFGLIHCPRHRIPKYNDKDKLLHSSGNLTLLNAFLWFFGPMSEKRLVIVALSFQALCCALGFYIRYYLASYFY